MIYLFLCIISSTLIFVIFKSITLFKVSVLPVIIINYLVASTLGYFLSSENPFSIYKGDIVWLPLAILIGVLFIIMFFVVGKSSQTAGISVTTVASKLSVVIPISFSIFIDPSDSLSFIKFTAILIALLAVFLTIYRDKRDPVNNASLIYPIILFFGMGLVDSLVKLAQISYIGDGELPHFTAFLFTIAFFSGILYLLLTPGSVMKKFSYSSILWGTFLGICNFGSIYFIIRALNFRSLEGTGIDSSTVFGINNTGTVFLSVLCGYLIFRERLGKVNYIGILLSLAAIILFAYA